MSSSSDTLVLRDPGAAGVTDLRMPDLRYDTAGHDGGRGGSADPFLEELADSVSNAARARGYATGWAQGHRDAEVALGLEAEAAAERERTRAAEHAECLAALRRAAEVAQHELAHACRRVDEQALELALELTREIVGSVVPDPARVVARVAGLLPEHDVCSVRLHPDVALAADELRELGVTVVADPTLERADAVAQADDHVVDLRVEGVLERLREVLS